MKLLACILIAYGGSIVENWFESVRCTKHPLSKVYVKFCRFRRSISRVQCWQPSLIVCLRRTTALCHTSWTCSNMVLNKTNKSVRIRRESCNVSVHHDSKNSNYMKYDDLYLPAVKYWCVECLMITSTKPYAHRIKIALEEAFELRPVLLTSRMIHQIHFIQDVWESLNIYTSFVGSSFVDHKSISLYSIRLQ